MTSWTDNTLAELRRLGYRAGGARSAVVALLGEQHCCVTAVEIVERLEQRGTPVGVASVYRALDVLTEHGLVARMTLQGDHAYYEPAHVSGDHHHHIVCDGCGRIDTFADEQMEHAIHSLGERLGYRLVEHDVVLRGTCGDCVAAAG